MKNIARIFLTLLIIVISFAAISQPVITSFAPASGPIGTVVTINGSNFSTTPANNIVFFGAVRATVTSASANTLTVIAPSGANYKAISVTVNGLTGYSLKPFIVTFPNGTPLYQYSNQVQNSFVNVGDSTTDLHPREAVVSDFDGDGKPDIATANIFSITGEPGSFSALRNISTSGEFAFAAHQDFDSNPWTYSIAAGDMDGDGKQDVATIELVEGKVSVYRNTSVIGAISFAPKMDIAGITSPDKIFVADMDNDGKPDVVVINSPISGYSSVSIYKNISAVGSPAFAARSNYPLTVMVSASDISDFDGDGKLDIVIAENLFNTISVLRNTGSAGTFSFSNSGSLTTGPAPVALAAGDLDGDGKPEIVSVNNSNRTFSVFRNLSASGSIAFATKVDYGTANDPQHVAIADVNGDAKPDIIVSAANQSVSQNNCTTGSISFTPTIFTFPGRTLNSVGIADFTGDGKADIIGTDLSSEIITLLRNKNNEPTVYTFTPDQTTAGTTVSISGLNFSGATAVSFGGMPATSFTIVNSTTITAVVGNGYSGNVEVTNIYGTGISSGFRFAGPPIITSFTPAAASEGDPVTIIGKNFTSVSSVKIGVDNVMSFTVETPERIKAIVSSLSQSGNITVTTSYGSATMPGFVILPKINSFYPTTAATGGSVSISGTKLSLVTGVSFGGVPAASFTINDNYSISAIVGQGATGNVTVTSVAGSNSRAGFTYIPPPVITSISPTSAPAGAIVVITGSNFNNVYTVRIGGTATSFARVNSTTINATVPTNSSGDITVIADGGTATFGGFTFIPKPEITSVLPITGGPGTVVTVTGRYLDGCSELKFGGTPAASFNVINSTTIRAVIGNGASGQISATTIAGTSYGTGFNFTPHPLITHFTPTTGTVGTSITITGASFSPTPANNIVYFGPVRGLVTSASSNELTVTVPSGAVHDRISVTVNGKTARSHQQFAMTYAGGGAPLSSSSFSGKTEFAAGDQPFGVAAGDFDNDGKPDLVSANFLSKTISVLRNLSVTDNLNFAEKIDFPVGFKPKKVAVADMDGDGKLDIVTINETVGNYNGTVLRNITVGSNISFASPVTFPTDFGPSDIIIMDYNQDGLLDVAVENTNMRISENNIVTVALNRSTAGSLLFDGPYSNHIGNAFNRGTPIGMDQGDFNNDGHPDLVVTYTDDYSPFEITVLRSYPSGGLNTESHILITNMPFTATTTRTATVADFDNDGLDDIICQKTAFRNTGNFTFQQQPIPDMGLISDAADLNGDGKTDHVSVNYNTNVVTAYGNNSSGTNISFQPKIDFTTGNNPYGLAIADLDADGKPEIITANYADKRIAVLKNRTGVSGYTVQSFIPSVGTVGTVITITGADFSNITGVKIGGVPATSFTVNSSTSITAIVGQTVSGAVSVSSATLTESYGWFTFIPPPPTITSFTPTSGGAGTVVTINGTNFREVSKVSFGGVDANYYIVVSPTVIEAVPGSGANGRVEVVTLGGTGYKDGFTFIGAPTITSFSPTSAGEGMTVTITGTNLNGATTVKFGNMDAQSFISGSATTVTAIVGTGASGKVYVKTPGGEVELSGFTFIQSPVIASFTPTHAATGALVSINGKNFSDATSVKFGGVNAQTFTVNSATSIWAIVGAGASGEVTVTTSKGTYSLAGFTFDITTGTIDPVIPNSDQLTVYPNPVDDWINITHPLARKGVTISIYQLEGKLVRKLTPEVNSKKTETYLGDLCGGIYILTWDERGKRFSRIIIVR